MLFITKQKYFFFSFILIILFVFSLQTVFASTLYFDPQETTLGIKQDFVIALNIDADKPINTISVAIKIPIGIEPFDTSDGNSIINDWIDRPHFDAQTRLLTFSGIIPGGFSGKGGRLLAMTLNASEQGNQVLTIDSDKTEIYLNTANGIKDTITIKPVTISIIQGKDNFNVSLPDTVPPEDFTPIVTHDLRIYDNQSFVIFSAQDKGSGMFGYEVAEKRGSEETNYQTLSWNKAESPYLLKDQDLKSFIYVKAIDKAGNIRVKIIKPHNPLSWYENNKILDTLIIVIILIIIFIIWIKRKQFVALPTEI